MLYTSHNTGNLEANIFTTATSTAHNLVLNLPVLCTRAFSEIRVGFAEGFGQGLSKGLKKRTLLALKPSRGYAG